jgi:uncharacterized membrane protein
MATIRNPIEWGLDQLKLAAHAVESAGRSVHRGPVERGVMPIALQRIGLSDLGAALADGFRDFAAYRSDVIFLCVIYPIAGLVLARVVFHYDMLPLLFPLAAGFALIGPIAAVGLYEMSRRREHGEVIGWAGAFGVIGSPSFGAIVILSLILLAIFLLWLVAAQTIYGLTLGPAPPASPGIFLREVFATPPGRAMIVLGVGTGFLFALAVLAISVVSFPLLLDRDVGLDAAVWASIRAVAINPYPMAVWGLIVAGSLLLGSLPLFLGLIVVMPVLGHATWHLYRRVVPRPG